MSKVTTIEKAVEAVPDGATVMVGGFLGVGTPADLLSALVKRNVQNLTLICNDTAMPDKGSGKLIVNKQVKKVIATHIGTNPETGRQMMAGELEVELSPQGTFNERIRAGGGGLGGVLTPTGVGTVVEEGKQRINVDGRDYLLEKPLKADVSLLFAHKADKAGNLVLKKSTRTTNTAMAMAGALVIAEAREIVETGQIDPDEVTIPGLLVDMVVPAAQGGDNA